MTIQTINIGTLPNAGDGDPLRTAFNKINLNFTDLFSATAANTANNTADQVIFSTLATSFTQATYQIHSKNPATADFQNVTIAVAKSNDGNSVAFTPYGAVNNGTPITTYTMDINTGNVRILCSPLANVTLNHLVHRLV